MSEDIEIGELVESECEFEDFVLDNGMKVILISSKKLKSCGATLTIQIGKLHEPPNLGFVHLLEHVIIRNMTIPDQNFGAIINKDGGYVNAATSNVHSKYYYRTQFINTSLGLFVKSIFHPDFDAQFIATEIENVDSEYIIDSTDDTKCLNEFMNAKWFPDEIDNLYGFQGNKYTLQTKLEIKGIDIIQELKNLHGKLFSTNLMSLIVFAKDDMISLKKLVTDIFKEEKNKHINLSKDVKEFSPISRIANYGDKWSIVPTQHDKLLKILFPLANAYFEFGPTPLNYIINLFQYEGDESLLSSLKTRYWCTSVSCYNLQFDSEKHYSILQFNLTQQGLDHIEDIIQLVFHHVNMLQYFVNRHQLKDDFSAMIIRNNLPTAASVENDISNITQYINLTEFKNVLKMYYNDDMHEKFPEAIKEIIEYTFTPLNIIIYVSSKEEETNKITPSQIRYKVDTIPQNTIFRWSRTWNKNFVYPQETAFAKNLMDIYDAPACNEKDREQDRVERTTNELDFTFYPRKESLFEMFLQLSSEKAYDDAKSCNLNNMLAYVLRDSMSEKLYSAKNVGITCQIDSNRFGIRVIIKNYRYTKQLINILLREIMSVMKTNELIGDSRFEMLKEQYITYLRNLASATPDEQAFYYLEVLLTHETWTYEELLNEIEDLTSGQLNQFINEFYNNKFMQCVIHANMTRSEIGQVINYLESDCCNSIECQCRPPDVANDIIFESGCHYLYTTNTVFHKSSGTMVYYQIGEQGTNLNHICKYSHILYVINAIISEHCCDELRGKTSLGYIVKSIVTRMNNTWGLAIYVVGHRYELKCVEEKIDDFMKKMLHKVNNMSPAEFANYKTKADYYNIYKKLSLAGRLVADDIFWDMSLLRFTFDQNKEHECSASVQEFAKIFKEMIDPATRRKLSIHIKSKINRPVTAQQSAITTIRSRSMETVAAFREDKPTEIKDIALFKRQFRRS